MTGSAEQPLVSIIMPSYQHGAFIGEAIASIQAQTFPSFELLIVDDGSSDASPEIIGQYAAIDSRIVPIFHTHNQGIAAAVNSGLDRVRGEYVAWTASDDRWLPDHLATMVAFAAGNPQCVAWADAYIIDGGGKREGTLFSDLAIAAGRPKKGRLTRHLAKGNYLCGQTRMVRREIIGNLRFDRSLTYLNDWWFDLELSTRAEHCFLDYPITEYRIHDESSNQTNKAAWRRDAARIMGRVARGELPGIPRRQRVRAALSLARYHLRRVLQRPA